MIIWAVFLSWVVVDFALEGYWYSVVAIGFFAAMTWLIAYGLNGIRKKQKQLAELKAVEAEMD
jgi:hypothetical protein